MPVTHTHIPTLLAHRAQEKPNDPAYTFIDFDVDPEGYRDTVTWSQLRNRAQVVAAELATCASPGDRVALLAPQSMEYIIGFYGALEAGMIAVPLPVPMFGVHDERVSAALRDCQPAAILTTTAAVGDLASSINDLPGKPPVVIEVDALDLDSEPIAAPTATAHTKTAFLQYTSGSTRTPAGVMVGHQNAIVNMQQMIDDTFENVGKTVPADTTLVVWLPFYHDLGLMCGIIFPLVGGHQAVVFSPMAFLAKPARWMQLVASYPNAYTGGPNFAYELAVRRTSDEDMAGLDLSRVHTYAFGAERVHAATLRRLVDRFSKFNLNPAALRPGYGLAEATVYLTSNTPGTPPPTARFDYTKLANGTAELAGPEGGVELVSCGVPRACTVRVVDPDTQRENPEGQVGEIWAHGTNVTAGYWHNQQATEATFGGKLVDPSPGTPQGPWLKTGDLGVISDGELYIVGRIKDLLIVDGRNHYPDDIEATIQEITGGRVAAVSIADSRSEQLVTIAEFKNKGGSDAEIQDRLHEVRRKVAAALSKAHGLAVGDLVLVPQGAIPITTSGKIRRSSCVEIYQRDGFDRLDASARSV
ncbi:AMP-binding protein [Mycolicibacter sp. MYC123]|uniref:AMP-binding protein n=1 Tax=[Mycobacterium] zoologicum TaxID=2872311 RepID=A0ABU5YEV5_9MYCO|nr:MULTISPECIES: AMP-binding protein [unclassified Mycolicibacter]MEB3048574.1 AMP-binding protein [Mycolicibacter sp. MYC123]MEB3063022.1 AMP-binding protein [Mycolicibacter sp. MYC101]